MSTQRKIRSEGAYVIKSAESRPPRASANGTYSANRTSGQPSTTDRRVARALKQHKQQ